MIMAGKSDFSAVVWAVIRELYESTPSGFGIEKIRQKAAEFLGDEPMPSYETIRYHIKTKQWQKQVHKQVGLDSKKLKKTIQELTETINGHQGLSNQAVASLANMEIEVRNKNLFSMSAFEKRKSAQVILEHRIRSNKAGLLIDDAIGKLQKQMDILLNFAQYYEDNPDEFLGLDIETAYNNSMRLYDKMISAINASESVVRSAGMLAKLDFVLYGLNPEDTREPESEKRITSLMDDDEYYQKKQALLKAEGERIAQRMQMIQSGQFEEEVQQEMIQLAKNDTIDDAEFDEIL